MAASFSPTQRQEDFREEFLKCSICSEFYDNDQHKAKCLPCLHTYCKLCLENHASGRSKFHCPSCRSSIILANGNVDKLQNNFIVENLKDYHDIFSLSSVTCGSCEDIKNIAESFCHDCECFLCQECVGAHKRLGPLRFHKLSTLAALQKQKCNPISQCSQKCEKHLKQDLNFYCRNRKCKIPVCASCGLTDHKNHDLVDLTVAINEVIIILQSLSSHICNKNQDEVHTEQTKIEATKKTLTDNYEMKQKNMLKSKEILLNLIESQYAMAESHLQSLYDKEMDRLSGAMEILDSLSAQMTSACDFANQACDTSNPIDILTSQVYIRERLLELDNKEVPLTIMDKIHFILTEQHYSALSEIQDLVKHLFQSDWEMNLSHCQDDSRSDTSESEVKSKSSPIKISRKVKKSNSFVSGKLKKYSSFIQLSATSSKTLPTSLSKSSEKASISVSLESLSSTGNRRWPIFSTSSKPQKESSLSTKPDKGATQVTQCSTSTEPKGATHHSASTEHKEGATQSSTSEGASLSTKPDKGATQRSAYSKPKEAASICSTSTPKEAATQCSTSAEPKTVAILRSTSPGSKGKEPLLGTSFDPQVDPSRCIMEFQFNPNLMSRVNVVIQTIDRSGKPMTTGGLQIEVKQEKEDGTSSLHKVQDNGNGTYIFGYKKGSQNAQIHVKINGVPIKGSPFNPYRIKQKLNFIKEIQQQKLY